MRPRRIRGVWAIFASLGLTIVTTFINYFDIQNSVWNNINSTLYSVFGPYGFPPNFLPSAYGNLPVAFGYAIIFALFTFTISFSVALEANHYARGGKL